MRNRKAAAFVLCAAVLAGCAETPDQPIVREKGSSQEVYQEVSQKGETSEKAGTADGDSQDGTGTENTGETAAGENVLAVRLEAPETYQRQTEEEGNVSVTFDAKVEIPDTDHVAVMQVGQLPLDDVLIDRLTEGFFGDSPVYDGERYFQITKEEALGYLETLRGYQAQGNRDPYGYIAQAREDGEEDLESFYSLEDEIAVWEKVWQDAPEEKEKVEVTPRLDQDHSFVGAAEMDGGSYRYELMAGGPDAMSVRVRRMGDNQSEVNWTSGGIYDTYKDNPEILEGKPSLDEAEEMAGITRQEAVRRADEYIQRLGLTEFEARNAYLSLGTQDESDHVRYTDTGYMVEYTRTADGFPVTNELNYGGGLESMDSTRETWGYEKVSLVINKEGLQYAEILNLYRLGEKQVENVEMKSFPEIMEIFQQMIQIKGSGQEGSSRDYHVQEIRLGYMRVYDPGADASAGLLVPVWGFFGCCDLTDVYDGEVYSYTNAERNSSFLTINAADGTVIDRSLGY